MRKLFLFTLTNLFSISVALTQNITFDFDTADPNVKVGHALGPEPFKLNDELHVTITDINSSAKLSITFNTGDDNIANVLRSEIAAQFPDGNIPSEIKFSVSGNSVKPYGKVLKDQPFTIHVVNGTTELKSIAFISDDIDVGGARVVDNEGVTKSNIKDKFYENTKNVMEPFKDAVSLRYYISRNFDTPIIEILADYLPISTTASWADLLDVIEKDQDASMLLEPLKSVTIITDTTNDENIGMQTGGGLIETQGSPSSILTSPTILIDALAQLIAKRFKEELSVKYIENFKTWLQTNHVDKLLPHTYRVMTFQEPVNYKTFLPLVRSALHKDYMDTPDNLYSFASQDDIKAKVGNANIYTGLMSGLYILKRRADLPADILEDAVEERFISDGDGVFRDYLIFLKALSVNLRADNTYTGWIKSEDLQELLVGNKTNLQLFAGLLFLKEGKDRGESMKGLLVGNTVLEKLREDKSENVKRFFRVYRSIQDVQANVEAVDFQKIAALDQDIKIQAQIQRAKQLHKLIASTLVLGKEIGTLDKDQFDKLNVVLNEILVTIESAYNREYGGIVNGILSIIDNLDLELSKDFNKYATFTVNLLNAQNTNDALLALETVAMPVGGYRVKRKSTISASVTSYPGLFGAREIFRGTDFEIAKEALADNGDEVDARHFSWGFTAPVGVSLDFGFNTTGAKNLKGEDVNVDIPGSFSLFVSLIDIGSVVSFRLQDNVSTLPELKWSNVVAPGLYASFGFRNTPLTAIFGYQYGPNLREITTIETEMDGTKTEATYVASAHRWGASFVVDISLLNIFAKGR